jgi:hypothetical protein
MLKYEACVDQVRDCLREADREDISEERRRMLHWMAGQWQQMADELERLEASETVPETNQPEHVNPH